MDYIERWWDEDEQKVMDSQKSVTNYTEVESSTTVWDGDTTGGWYVVSGSVEISSRVTVVITGGKVEATGGDQASGIGGGGEGGDGCGFYINGAPVPVAVAHIS